ncbi:MAG TPA: pentapeptide repeat-containing protein [Thermoanaerobaculia bacterium]|jgi:hypothetical protein
MPEKQKAVARILAAQTAQEMREIAERYDMIAGGKIDLRDTRCRFNHAEIDLKEFLLTGCDLSGSTLTNCMGEGVSFDGCRLKQVRITAEKGRKVSFQEASFNEAFLEDVTIGPRTLDLSRTMYRKARLRNVTFTMGKLFNADFTGALFEDVFFRSAELKSASFRGASLTRVSFEKATLEDADFSQAEFHQMEHWGEPDFSGAKISDDLRYRYGIVRDPSSKIVALINSGRFNQDEAAVLSAFLERNRDFLSNPEVMLIGSEYDIDAGLFVKIMKALKEEDVIH